MLSCNILGVRLIMAWCKNVFQKQFLYWYVSFENPWKRRPFVIDWYHFLILAIFVLLHFVSFYKENYFETYCLMLGSDETGRASWNSPPQGDDILRIVVGPEKVRKNCQFKWYRFNVKQSFKINNGNNMSSISKEKMSSLGHDKPFPKIHSTAFV